MDALRRPSECVLSGFTHALQQSLCILPARLILTEVVVLVDSAEFFLDLG